MPDMREADRTKEAWAQKEVLFDSVPGICLEDKETLPAYQKVIRYLGVD